VTIGHQDRKGSGLKQLKGFLAVVGDFQCVTQHRKLPANDILVGEVILSQQD